MSGGYHPWSKFNAHRWSNLNARRQAGTTAIGWRQQSYRVTSWSPGENPSPVFRPLKKRSTHTIGDMPRVRLQDRKAKEDRKIPTRTTMSFGVSSANGDRPQDLETPRAILGACPSVTVRPLQRGRMGTTDPQRPVAPLEVQRQESERSGRTRWPLTACTSATTAVQSVPYERLVSGNQETL